MLIRLIVENIFSFYESTEFNMLPNPKRGRFSEHVYKKLPVKLLKQSVIYGANGAGKSNLLNILELVKKYVCDKDYINSNLLNNYKFRLVEQNKKPISIELEFIEGQTCFYYSMSVSLDGSKESLYLSGCGKGEDKLIFERNSTINKHHVKFFDKAGKSLNNKAIDGVISSYFSKNRFSSTFAMIEDIGLIKDVTIKKAYKWFHEELFILNSNPKLKTLISYMEKDESFAVFATKTICSMGVGISNVEVRTEPFESYIQRVIDSDEQRAKFLQIIQKEVKTSNIIPLGTSEIVYQKGQILVKTLEFTQVGQNGYEGKIEFQYQSNGTIQLMHLMRILYDISHRKCVYCVDEIEDGIHPINIKEFIKRFSSNAQTKGQLIFTTHECFLLNQQELMRADEVWFTEKLNGSTKLYSLNDFKLHNTIDIEKGYLAGRYGAIPYIGEIEHLDQ